MERRLVLKRDEHKISSSCRSEKFKLENVSFSCIIWTYLDSHDKGGGMYRAGLLLHLELEARFDLVQLHQCVLGQLRPRDLLLLLAPAGGVGVPGAGVTTLGAALHVDVSVLVYHLLLLLYGGFSGLLAQTGQNSI